MAMDVIVSVHPAPYSEMNSYQAPAWCTLSVTKKREKKKKREQSFENFDMDE